MAAHGPHITVPLSPTHRLGTSNAYTFISKLVQSYSVVEIALSPYEQKWAGGRGLLLAV